MYIDISEMNTVIDDYKLREMTDNTDSITTECLAAAESRVRSYLATRYDTARIFSAKGPERNAEVVAIVKNTALYFLCRRHNIDILYDRVKEAYQADMAYLKEVAKGTLAADLPIKKDANGEAHTAIRMGSHPKFDHDY